MVGRTHRDVHPQKISAHSIEPFSRYELMKTFVVKMRILGWFSKNLHKNLTAQYFLKRVAPKFSALLPLQHILI
jgi:hypothetical protein